MQVYELLGLDKVDNCVAVIQNATSSKYGKKDIIKIAGGMDVYQVKTEKGNILFPAAPGVIVQKDIQAGRMVVDKKRLNEVCVDG